MNFGPQHPAAHGVLRLVLEMDGEVVERADPHIGLLHRGTEKLIEYRTYIQACRYFDRLDYVSPMCQEHAFALAIEKLLGIRSPARGQVHPRAVRRDHPHPQPPPQHHDLRARRRRDDAAALGLRGAREADGVLRARLGRAPARQLFPPRRRRARPAGRAHRRHPRLDRRRFPEMLDDIERLLTDNRIFQQRTGRHRRDHAPRRRRTGASPGRCCAARASPGTCARAQPYEVYEQIDFDIPVGKNGDCFDRYLVRMRGDAPVAEDHARSAWSRCPKGPVKIEDARSRRRRAAR